MSWSGSARVKWFDAHIAASLLPFFAIFVLAPLLGIAIAGCDRYSDFPTPDATRTPSLAPHYGIPSVTASPFASPTAGATPTDFELHTLPVTDTPVTLPTSSLAGTVITATETADFLALTGTPIPTIVPGGSPITVEGTAAPPSTLTDSPTPVPCTWQTLYRDEHTWLQQCVP